jgi:hypothetical protein
MSVYKNDRIGRDKVIGNIEVLEKDGYTRRDYQGSKVVLEKTVIKGMKSIKKDIVEFIFVRAKGEIHEVRSSKCTGLETIKEMLYGFTSPYIEAGNAIKAGLIDVADMNILKEQFTNSEWYMS